MPDEVCICHICSNSNYIRWTFSLEFNPSTHKCDEMTAWNPSKFDTTIWQCHKSVVMSCCRSAPYHAAVQQALNPLLWSLVVWPRFHAQVTPTQKIQNFNVQKSQMPNAHCLDKLYPPALDPSSPPALHSLLQLSFMSADCSHEGKIGKGSEVSDFYEWNRIRHCRSSALWVCIGVLAWHIFHRLPVWDNKSRAATTLEQSHLLIKVSASNPPVTTSYSLHFVSYESYVQSFSPPSAKQPASISLSGFGDRTPWCLSDMAPSRMLMEP